MAMAVQHLLQGWSGIAKWQQAQHADVPLLAQP
jgi:hypothetical protein